MKKKIKTLKGKLEMLDWQLTETTVTKTKIEININ